MRSAKHHPRTSRTIVALILSALTSSALFAQTAAVAPSAAIKAKVSPAAAQNPIGSPCSRVEMGPIVRLAVGKATLIKPESPVARILLGNPENSEVAKPVENDKNDGKASTQKSGRPGAADIDVLLLSPNEIYLLGKTIGSSNMVLLDRAGRCTVLDVSVGVDTAALAASLKELLPGETGIKLTAAADSIVLTGTISDAAAADKAIDIATAYVRRVSAGSAGSRAGANDSIINMLSVAAPQQVMLEVKVAEISRTLLDKLGVDLSVGHAAGNWAFSLLSSFGRTDANGLLSVLKSSGRNPLSIGVDAQKDNGLVKVLAEPNVLAISGQEGSFLAGGKIFIPVAQNNSGTGGTTITLEEKEFGVALKFTPTVLGDGRINLKVSPEVSELNSQGIGISLVGSGATSIMPSFTTRKASTTVQLYDGQSFAIGGLIKNNVTTNIKAFPLLGEIPVLGALFRSSDFQTDKTELVFVVTPRLVKPLPPNYALPTDGYTPPTRSQFFLNGQMEGSPTERTAPVESQAGPDGFEVK